MGHKWVDTVIKPDIYELSKIHGWALNRRSNMERFKLKDTDDVFILDGGEVRGCGSI